MPPLNDEQRRLLTEELSSLAPARLQKLWLLSAQRCVLELRAPGRTQLALIDAALSFAALIDARPTAPESAPTSQATLRRALVDARLLQARLASIDGALAPWLDFETPRGPRTLLAERALLLLDGERKILWASAGALRRPGAQFPGTPFDAVRRRAEIAAPAHDAEGAEHLRAIVRDALAGEEVAGLAARRREISQRIAARIKKARRTLAAVEEDLARASSASGDRARAELLLPHASRIPRGTREVQLPDWSRTNDAGEPAQVTIALDPALGAAENASRWLKKAKRYASAIPRIEARREEILRELLAAEELLERARTAPDAEPLAAVERELPAPREKRSAGARAERLPYRTFLAQNGDRILVGRGARDNDALTFRIARGNDLWLHARAVTGAHVIVPGAGAEPDSRTLGDAALLAAHFSSLRGEAQAEVQWTRCKHLRKPKGGAPGSVLVTQEKTLRVRSSPERLLALLRSER